MKKYYIFFFLHSLAFGLPLTSAQTSEPVLTLTFPPQTFTFSRSELLARKDAVTLTIGYDPTFPGRSMVYRAVPIKPLFDQLSIPKNATLQFKCLDGFSAPMDPTRLLNASPKKATAFLAIEQPGEKWPTLPHGSDPKATAAPFYVVWVNPEKSHIGPEEWPYQLAGFEVVEPVESKYPKIVPVKSKRGFQVFLKNCFACHTMNLQGQAQVGPDLNLPMNPTEYMQEKGLRTLIRDPQKLRHWPQAKMSGFGRDAISDADLEELIAYLKEMAEKR